MSRVCPAILFKPKPFCLSRFGFQDQPRLLKATGSAPRQDTPDLPPRPRAQGTNSKRNPESC